MLRLSKLDVAHYERIQNQITSIREELNSTFFNKLTKFQQEAIDARKSLGNAITELVETRTKSIEYQRDLINVSNDFAEVTEQLQKYIAKYGKLQDNVIESSDEKHEPEENEPDYNPEC